MEDLIQENKNLEMQLLQLREAAVESLSEKDEIILKLNNQITEMELKHQKFLLDIDEFEQEKKTFEFEREMLREKYIEIARNFEQEVKHHEINRKNVDKKIDEEIERKIGIDLGNLTLAVKDWKQNYKKLEERYKFVDAENSELKIKYINLEEELKRKRHFAKGEISSDLKKDYEMQIRDLQSENLESDIRKKEIQKKLDMKEKELVQQKEKYNITIELIQKLEQQLEEREWWIFELKKEFDEKIFELETQLREKDSRFENRHYFKKETISEDLLGDKSSSLSNELNFFQKQSTLFEADSSSETKQKQSISLFSLRSADKIAENADTDHSEFPPEEKLNKETLGKPKSFKAIEILHHIARNKIKRLEVDYKDLRASLTINSNNYHNPKIRPLLLFQEIERAFKLKQALLTEIEKRIDQLGENNARNPNFNEKDLIKIKESLKEKTAIIDEIGLEMEQRLKIGKEVEDSEIDGFYESVYKLLANADTFMESIQPPEEFKKYDDVVKKLFEGGETLPQELETLRIEIIKLLKNEFKNKQIETLKKELFIRDFEIKLSHYKSILGELLSEHLQNDEKAKALKAAILEFLQNEHGSEEINLIKSSMMESLVKDDLMQSKGKRLLETIMASVHKERLLKKLKVNLSKFIKGSKTNEVSKINDESKEKEGDMNKEVEGDMNKEGVEGDMNNEGVESDLKKQNSDLKKSKSQVTISLEDHLQNVIFEIKNYSDAQELEITETLRQNSLNLGDSLEPEGKPFKINSSLKNLKEAFLALIESQNKNTIENSIKHKKIYKNVFKIMIIAKSIIDCRNEKELAKVNEELRKQEDELRSAAEELRLNILSEGREILSKPWTVFVLSYLLKPSIKFVTN